MTGITHPWQGHYMQPAFEGFVHWASGDPEMQDAFLAEHPISLPRNALEREIDRATGNDTARAQTFVDWCLKYFGRPEDIEERKT